MSGDEALFFAWLFTWLPSLVAHFVQEAKR